MHSRNNFRLASDHPALRVGQWQIGKCQTTPLESATTLDRWLRSFNPRSLIYQRSDSRWWIAAIEFLHDFADLGAGQGGYNEDHEFYGYRMPI